MKDLAVYLNGARVGSLAQDDSGLLQFRYDQEWLSRPDAVPLSRMLPLQSEVFRGNKARPFFAGILPEEGPRKKIAAILGISEKNDFAMLERIGGECAGAVSLLPAGTPPVTQGTNELRPLSDEELEGIIAELPRRPLMAGMKGLRLSLAGAQDKLPVAIHGGAICLPLDDTPSTHIIKPEPEHFQGLVANELFCMTLAKAVGLNVPNVERRQIGGHPCILVERYDRAPNARGESVRIHQEDFCQALGFPPERKYQSEGGPLLRDCIVLLREWSSVPVLDICGFIDGLIFNMVVGNADAHGKNYSMLYRGKDRRLAPFYDLVCTLAWPELSQNLSMKIGGCTVMKTLAPAHWKKMAAETNLGWPMIRERMASLCQEILSELDSVLQQAAPSDASMVGRIADIIRARTARLVLKS